MLTGCQEGHPALEKSTPVMCDPARTGLTVDKRLVVKQQRVRNHCALTRVKCTSDAVRRQGRGTQGAVRLDRRVETPPH